MCKNKTMFCLFFFDEEAGGGSEPRAPLLTSGIGDPKIAAGNSPARRLFGGNERSFVQTDRPKSAKFASAATLGVDGHSNWNETEF